jgi:peptide chain release factor subunit 1
MQTSTDPFETLAELEPTPFPVLSAYLDLRPGEGGHAAIVPYLKTTLRRKAQRFEAGSEERRSYDQDAEALLALFEEGGRFAKPSGGTAAIFLCSESGLEEIVEYETPLDAHFLHVGHRPNLFNLAWTDERYARYAVMALDSQTARIYAFGQGRKLDEDELEGTSLGKTKAGGWSQARYQRRRRNFKQEHVEEAVERLREIVEDTGAEKVVLIGHERLISMARKALPKELEEKLAEEIPMDVHAPEDEMVAAGLEAFRRNDLDEDAERVTELFDAYRSDGLAVVGLEDTLQALLNGQAEEVLIVGNAEKLNTKKASESSLTVVPGDASDLTQTALQFELADSIVRSAERTGAEVRFIEEDERLSARGGVGAFLRYRWD